MHCTAVRQKSHTIQQLETFSKAMYNSVWCKSIIRLFISEPKLIEPIAYTTCNYENGPLCNTLSSAEGPKNFTACRNFCVFVRRFSTGRLLLAISQLIIELQVIFDRMLSNLLSLVLLSCTGLSISHSGVCICIASKHLL